MTCTPCQQRAEARRQAMIAAAIEQNPELAKSIGVVHNSYSDPVNTLPRHEGPTEGILPRIDEMPSNSVWNDGYLAFMQSRWNNAVQWE